MNKQLQDLAWSVLPKEFKEEVKNRYKNALRFNEYAHLCVVCRELFGEHSLTSDAEPEEMVMCVRKDVLDLYQEALVLIDRGNRNNYLNDKLIGIGQKNVLYTLFGSKCLLDNVDGLSQNPPENCDNGNLISTDDNKPAGPKFEVGQLVMFKGRKVEIIGYSDHSPQLYRVFVLTENYHTNAKESDLEPCRELEEQDSESLHTEYVEKQRIASEESHLRNLSQETASGDKHFDAILKDNFRSEHRLNIAASIAVGWLACHGMTNPETIARDAFAVANALIAEGEKGGAK